MLPASTRGIGMALGFPDVCNTPVGPATAPLPYPNIADHSAASGTASNVKLNMLDALTMASSIPTSSGDEAGSAHPTIKGAQRYTIGMPNILINLMPAITLACLTSHNNMNCPIGAVIVPSAPNVFFNRALSSYASPHTMNAGDAAALAEAARCSGLASAGALLRIESFSLGFASELAAAIDASVRAGAGSCILDLRACRGGVLNAAIDAAELFLPRGRVIATMLDEDGDARTWLSRGGSLLEIPLVLWISEQTASAAEVFAAALAHNLRATLIGEQSYGKGIVTEARSLGDGSFASVPVGGMLLPDGSALEGRGLNPGTS